MFVRVLNLDHQYDDDAHCTSHFISEKTQLAFRALALGYCVSTIISSLVYTDSLTFFTFFTNLSYMLLTVYFGVIVGLTLTHNPITKPLSSKKASIVNVLLEIVATNALFLDIVYWTLLYRLSSGFTNMEYFYCFNVHMINLLIITTEVVTSKFRFFPRHLAFTLMFLMIYSVFSIVFFLLSHKWIYPILDWTNPKAPIYYTLCYALNISCFFAMFGIYRLRERIAAKRRGGFVMIESVEVEEARGSLPKIEEPATSCFPGFCKPREEFTRIDLDGSLAKIEDAARQHFAKDAFPIASYGAMKPTMPVYPIQYPIVATAGSGGN